MLLSAARVMEITEIAVNHYALLLEETQMAREALPGQFIHIRAGETLDPFLRRPFSIAGAFPREGALLIIFRAVGKGTGILRQLRGGESLDCLGPLGSGFKPRKEAALSVLVAGGIGVAPLLFLARSLQDKGKKILFFYGAASRREHIPVEKFLFSFPREGYFGGEAINIEVFRATEDGSLGFRGTVTELLEETIWRGLQPEEIFACGPRPMLRLLAEKNKIWNFPLQISLEERMACGVGACQGCAVKIQNGKEVLYRPVCRYGPVFYSHEVIW